jgi:hypothetical protein
LGTWEEPPAYAQVHDGETCSLSAGSIKGDVK